MSVRILTGPDHVEADNACVLVPCKTAEDAGEALKVLGVNGEAQRLLRDFDASCEDAGNIYHYGKRIVLIGLAKANAYGKVRQTFQVLSGKLRHKEYDRHILLLSHLKNHNDLSWIADAAVNGWLLGRHDFGILKSGHDGNAETMPPFDVLTDDPSIAGAVHVAEAAAATQRSIYNLVNLPSNHKSPQTLADWAVASGRNFNYHVEVLDEHALLKGGFHAVLAVNRGSEHPARFVIAQYNGTDDPDSPLIALVGKGVTFDTGGVNVKLGDSMHLMKSDMGGAAAVLGAIDLLARLKAPVRVVVCTPCTDNSIGTLAIKPGDVINSHSGKTIEVINTDAEGRLILSDALHYVNTTFKPDAIVDLATLTGSVIRALGSHCAGMYTHSDHLAQELISAGELVGERLWRLPLWDEYGEEMKSEIADIKNLSDKPAAGSITAAKFLEAFVDNHPEWAHLDIAGVAFKANGISKSHASTAYGVRLLYEFVSRYSK